MKTLLTATISFAALMFLAPIGGARAGEAALPSTAEICAAVKPLGERVDRIAHRRLEAEYVDPEGEEAASRKLCIGAILVRSSRKKHSGGPESGSVSRFGGVGEGGEDCSLSCVTPF
jgi:hypothetical protein